MIGKNSIFKERATTLSLPFTTYIKFKSQLNEIVNIEDNFSFKPEEAKHHFTINTMNLKSVARG